LKSKNNERRDRERESREKGSVFGVELMRGENWKTPNDAPTAIVQAAPTPMPSPIINIAQELK